MVDKKGQSALEYLMTYGWALVVIVIVVAALVVFGVFSTPTNCSQFTGRLLLKDFAVTGTGIQLVIQNNSTSNISSVSASGSTLGVGTGDNNISVGGTATYALSGTLTGSVNETVTVSYTTADSLNKTEQTTCVATIS